MYGGSPSSLPGTVNQWLYCDGSAISRTSFSNLFEIIGTRYGVGDGSTTFNLPDYRSKFPYGTATSSSSVTSGGSATITLSTAQLPSHTHAINPITSSSSGAHGHTINDPPHTHSVSSSPNVITSNTISSGTGAYQYSGSTSLYSVGSLFHSVGSSATGISINSNGAHTHTISGTTVAEGSGNSIAILPPYQTIHFIIRT